MRILLLGLIWWLCSAIAEPFFIVMALVSLLLVCAAAHRLGLFKESSLLVARPSEAVQYFVWLLKEIYHSTLAVTRVVWQVAPRPKPVLGWVESSLKDPALLALYGNSITLTPGTITADIVQEKNRTLVLVHALQLSGYKDVESGRIAKKIARTFAMPAKKKSTASWW